MLLGLEEHHLAKGSNGILITTNWIEFSRTGVSKVA